MPQVSKKKLAGIGIWLGVIWSFLRFLWDRIGDVQTAESLFEDRDVIVRWLTSPYAGPLVALTCLLVFLYFHFGSRDIRQAPEPNPGGSERVDEGGERSSTLAVLAGMGATFGTPSRPELIVRYEPQPFHSILRAPKEHGAPLRMRNGGQKTAREIRIEPVLFSGHKATFRPPDTLLATDPEQEVKVLVHSDSGEITGETLGGALENDLWNRGFKGDKSTEVSFPLSLTYRDFNGAAYEDIFDLLYDHLTHQVTLRMRWLRRMHSFRHYSVRSLELPAICRVITIEDIVLTARIRYAAVPWMIAVRSISSIG